MFKTLKLAGFAAILAVCSLSTGANAAFVSVVSTAPASWNAVNPANSVVVNGTWATEPSKVFGSLANEYKSPFDPAGSGGEGKALKDWEKIEYYTTGSPLQQGSPAILSFGPATYSVLSLLWGSVDTYNAIEFLLGGVKTAFVDGQQVINKGGTPVASGAAFVKITGVKFDQVKFFSNFGTADGKDKAAFEMSNIMAAVPLPAGALLLLTAVGGFGVARRLRKAA